MFFLKFIPIFFMIFVIVPNTELANAESEDPKSYKVLSNNNEQFSISNVQSYLSDGDILIKKGDFDGAKEKYDKARSLAKQLAGFYRDLNGSFKGIDARIPLEMQTKGKKSIRIWAESNERLAALYKRKKQPEVAVPLLVEIVRLMTPNSPEGKKAYEKLIQLGFVNTSYKGF